MTARKRKQPEKKKKTRRGPALVVLGLAMRGLSFAGRMASRNPGVFGGSTAFVVVFSFVAANAMWYQPGVHPSPLLRTRVPFSHPQAANLDDPAGLSPRKVTTFVIQREAETPTASIRQPKREPEPAQAQVTSGQPAAVSGSAVVMEIQKQLARRGLYDGPADGKTGPKTSAAVLRFEKQAGRPETGVATDALLAALKKQPQQETALAAARPAERPYETVKGGNGGKGGEVDPVAAAIRNADADPQFIPRADIPASSELVMNIQKGLSNLAYSDVSIDGVAGEQTRAAIRHFEKHYRLPETGQPSDKVLKKMKEIGAL